MNDENEEAVGTGNDARVAMLDRINDANDRQRAGEFRDVVDIDNGQTENFVAGEQTEEEQAAAEAALQDADGDGTTQRELQRAANEANQEETFTIKVNGKDAQLTRAQMIERASKVEAADQYLATAAQLEREAREKVSAQPSHEDAETEVDSGENDLALVRALQMGTEEEALAAVKKLRTRTSAPVVDPNVVSRAVDERLALKEAAEKFQADYPEIFADPVLKKMAFDRDQALLNNGDRRAYRERFTEIGTELRNWVRGFAPKPTGDEPVVVNQDRTQRKVAASAKAAPASAPGAKTPTAPADDEKDESPSAVIARMAERRGGPQWMRN